MGSMSEWRNHFILGCILGGSVSREMVRIQQPDAPAGESKEYTRLLAVCACERQKRKGVLSSVISEEGNEVQNPATKKKSSRPFGFD